MGCFYFSFHWLTITSSTHLHLRSSQLSVSKGMSASDKGWGIWRQGRTDWNHFSVGKGGLILHFGSCCNWPVGRFRTFLLYLPGDGETVGRDRQRLGPGLLVDLGPWFPVPSLAYPRPLPFTGSILMSLPESVSSFATAPPPQPSLWFFLPFTQNSSKYICWLPSKVILVNGRKFQTHNSLVDAYTYPMLLIYRHPHTAISGLYFKSR